MSVLNITLPIKALSVNAAYRGRRFNTNEKNVFDHKLRLLLPKTVVEGKPYYRITYRFFLVNFIQTDQQNLLKCLTDGLVKRGIIKDDKYIIDESIRKFPSNTDRIEITVEGVGLETP